MAQALFWAEDQRLMCEGARTSSIRHGEGDARHWLSVVAASEDASQVRLLGCIGLVVRPKRSTLQLEAELLGERAIEPALRREEHGVDSSRLPIAELNLDSLCVANKPRDALLLGGDGSRRQFRELTGVWVWAAVQEQSREAPPGPFGNEQGVVRGAWAGGQDTERPEVEFEPVAVGAEEGPLTPEVFETRDV